jgi:hypothetical protein
MQGNAVRKYLGYEPQNTEQIGQSTAEQQRYRGGKDESAIGHGSITPGLSENQLLIDSIAEQPGHEQQNQDQQTPKPGLIESLNFLEAAPHGLLDYTI